MHSLLCRAVPEIETSSDLVIMRDSKTENAFRKVLAIAFQAAIIAVPLGCRSSGASSSASSATAAASSSASPVVTVPHDLNVVLFCGDEVTLHMHSVSLDLKSHLVVVTDDTTITGERVFGTDDLKPVRAALSDPELEAFMGAHIASKWEGKGQRCTLGLTSRDTKREQTTGEGMTSAMKQAFDRLQSELDKLASTAKESTFGACDSEKDCSLFVGPHCTCAAEGRPGGANGDKCVSNPCSNDMYASCDEVAHRCIVLTR